MCARLLSGKGFWLAIVALCVLAATQLIFEFQRTMAPDGFGWDLPDAGAKLSELAIAVHTSVDGGWNNHLHHFPDEWRSIWQGPHVTGSKPIECGILITFLSSCPHSRRVAERWNGRSSLSDREGNTVPVLWLSVTDADTRAATFASDVAQTDRFLQLQGRDRRSWGISRWPIPIVVGRGGTFLGELPQDPLRAAEYLADCDVGPPEPANPGQRGKGAT